MAKSKTQAQKKEEKELRHAQNTEERNIANEQHKRYIQQELANSDKTDIDSSQTALSKKERRAVKKKALKNEQAEGATSSLKEDIDASVSTGSPIKSVNSTLNSSSTTTLVNTSLEQASQRHNVALSEDVSFEIGKVDNDADARIPHNHSTHCPGLTAVCCKLAKSLPPKSTVVRGQLYATKSHYAQLEVHYQRSEDDSRHKFLVRSGHTAQDLWIVVPGGNCTIEDIKDFIKNLLDDIDLKHEAKNESSELLPQNHNRALADSLSSQWRKKSKAQHDKEQKSIEEAKEKQRINKQSRKLASHVVKSEAKEYAKRDVAIIQGTERTKNSMR